MVKKILGGALVASALLLTSCGYSAEEQKFYDACVAKAGDAAKLEKIKKAWPNEGDTAKKICASIIEKVNKGASEQLSSDGLKQVWKENTELVSKL